MNSCGMWKCETHHSIQWLSGSMIEGLKIDMGPMRKRRAMGECVEDLYMGFVVKARIVLPNVSDDGQ